MKVFQTVEHFFAWVVDKLIPKAETVAVDVENVIGSDAAQAILSLAGEAQWGPKLTSIVGSIVSALATAAKDGKDFSAAVAAYGLNVVLDEQAIADLEAVYNAVKSALNGKTVTVPVSVTVSK